MLRFQQLCCAQLCYENMNSSSPAKDGKCDAHLLCCRPATLLPAAASCGCSRQRTALRRCQGVLPRRRLTDIALTCNAHPAPVAGGRSGWQPCHCCCSFAATARSCCCSIRACSSGSSSPLPALGSRLVLVGCRRLTIVTCLQGVAAGCTLHPLSGLATLCCRGALVPRRRVSFLLPCSLDNHCVCIPCCCWLACLSL